MCPSHVLPVISAVGHETDTTIIDYVSDLRAPTPSAAAELAVYDVSLLLSQLEGMKAAMNRQMQGRIRLGHAKTQALYARLKMNSPMGKIREKRTFAMNLEDRLQAAVKGRIADQRHRLAIYIEKLKGLSPLDKLNQGYSYVSDREGRTITDIEKIALGDCLQIYVKNGRMEAQVTKKYPGEIF